MNEFDVDQGDQLPVDGREVTAKKLARIYGVTSLVLSILAVSFIGASTSSSVDDSCDYSSSWADEEDTYDDSWAPYDFNVWSSDSNIAWKWSESGDYTCGDYGCVEAQFISRYGCLDNFYAAVNWLDAPADEDGAVVGYDNSSLPALYSMQVARIQFEDIRDAGQSAQMAEIDCR